jgi:hypothetical protein
MRYGKNKDLGVLCKNTEIQSDSFPKVIDEDKV